MGVLTIERCLSKYEPLKQFVDGTANISCDRLIIPYLYLADDGSTAADEFVFDTTNTTGRFGDFANSILIDSGFHLPVGTEPASANLNTVAVKGRLRDGLSIVGGFRIQQFIVDGRYECRSVLGDFRLELLSDWHVLQSQETTRTFIATYLAPIASSGGGGTDPRIDCILYYLSWAIGNCEDVPTAISAPIRAHVTPLEIPIAPLVATSVAPRRRAWARRPIGRVFKAVPAP